MTLYSFTATAARLKPWKAAAKAALLAEAEAVQAAPPRPSAGNTKPGSDPHGWGAIIAKVLDPARLRFVGAEMDARA